MRSWLLSDRGKQFGIAFAAGVALLLASLVNFLNHNSYPFSRPEVGIITIAIVGLSALMAAWYLPQRQWGRSFLEGLLAAIFLDLNTDSLPLIVGTGVAVAGLTLWRRISLLGPMTILSAVIFVTTLVGLGGRPNWISPVDASPDQTKQTNNPAIIHLILDEHIGFAGLAAADQAGAELADELRRGYETKGFALYGGAYSQHYHSANSIPFMLNYGRRLGEIINRRGVQTGATEHFNFLSGQGYKLTVLQSDYAELCGQSRVDRCTTYDSSSLRPTLAAPMPVGERTELVTYKFLKLSDLFDKATDFWNVASFQFKRAGISIVQFNPSPGHSSSVGSLEAMKLMTAQLKQTRPGEAVVAHLLIPHHPYAVRRDCRYKARPWGGLRAGMTLPEKRAAYYEQLRCTRLKVDEAIAALDASPARGKYVMIIHGDHGSRINSRLNAFNQASGTIADDDMIATFSTLFAVRTASPRPGYIATRAPVAELLRDFAASNFRTPPAPKERSNYVVYLTDRTWKPVRTAPLPDWWVKGLDRPVKGQ